MRRRTVASALTLSRFGDVNRGFSWYRREGLKEFGLADGLHEMDIEARLGCALPILGLPQPVRAISVALLPHGRRRIFRAVSYPSIFGIPRSSSTMCGLKVFATASASTPS